MQSREVDGERLRSEKPVVSEVTWSRSVFKYAAQLEDTLDTLFILQAVQH